MASPSQINGGWPGWPRAPFQVWLPCFPDLWQQLPATSRAGNLPNTAGVTAAATIVDSFTAAISAQERGGLMTIYSAHDNTLMALLAHLGSHAAERWSAHWPGCLP